MNWNSTVVILFDEKKFLFDKKYYQFDTRCFKDKIHVRTFSSQKRNTMKVNFHRKDLKLKYVWVKSKDYY